MTKEKKTQVAGVIMTTNFKTLLFAGEDLVIFRYESGEIEITQYDKSGRKWTTIVDKKK